MRPTWLERKRVFFLTQAACNGVGQVILAILAWWMRFALNEVNVVFTAWAACCLAVWVVGYRRHRLRMRAVALMLVVNGHSREELWDLLTHDIIDYAAFQRHFMS